MNSNDLGKGIRAKWLAADLDSSVSGGLWLSFAGDGVAWPYCTYDIPVYSRTGMFNDQVGASVQHTYKFDAQVQFSVFGKTASEVTSAVDSITSVFDDASISVDDGTCLKFMPQSTVLERLETDVWQYILLYEAIVVETV